MAARVCKECILGYPISYGGLCRACDATLRYSEVVEPTENVFEIATERRAVARVQRAAAGDSEAKIFANRLLRFVRAGLDYDAAVHLAGLRERGVNLYVVEPGRFEELVAQGCPPHLAAEILR